MTLARIQVPSIRTLGVRVHMVQIPEVVGLMADWIENDRQRCHHIVNTGMHGIMEARRDPSFKAILNSADLFFPDGISMIWVARRRGFPLKKRGTGPELLREFCKTASTKGYRSFFLGDTDDTLDQLTGKLRAEFPGLEIAGTFSPPFRPITPEEDEEIIRMINGSKPDVLWIGLGCPKQERWIFEHKDRLDVPVAIGVGAYFKFHSGQVKRVPALVGDFGFEWLWRFLHEPRRLWRRVLIDGPRFGCNVILELTGLKKYD